MDYLLCRHEPVLLAITPIRVIFNPSVEIPVANRHFNGRLSLTGQCLGSGYRPRDLCLVRVIIFPHFQLSREVGWKGCSHCS